MENCLWSGRLEELEAKDLTHGFAAERSLEVLTKYIVRDQGRVWGWEARCSALASRRVRWERITEGAEDGKPIVSIGGEGGEGEIWSRWWEKVIFR